MVKRLDKLDSDENENARKHRMEEQENVLILFRMSVSLPIVSEVPKGSQVN